MIIISLGTRVEMVKSSILRHPIEQGIYHDVEAVQVYAFKVEILTKDSQFAWVFSLDKEIQIQPAAFTGDLYIVTSVPHLPV